MDDICKNYPTIWNFILPIEKRILWYFKTFKRDPDSNAQTAPDRHTRIQCQIQISWQNHVQAAFSSKRTFRIILIFPPVFWPIRIRISSDLYVPVTLKNGSGSVFIDIIFKSNNLSCSFTQPSLSLTGPDLKPVLYHQVVDTFWTTSIQKKNPEGDSDWYVL